ncbi:MAG: trigger factor [Leptolyngbyaceae cyanobacterium MO_188.B28]|nr:trigger factor [Leptolyngbyaceae cyanobacterium MO_188.B28]
MKVTQEQLPESQVGLEIEIPPEMSKKTYEEVLRKYMRTAHIPGFRKGKVPRQVLIQRFGRTQLKGAVLEELLQNSVKQAIEQEEIEALGNYQLRSSFDDLISQFEPGDALTLSIAVDVPPRVNLSQYKDLTVKAEEVKYDSSRVDEALEGYRTNLATLVPIEDRSAEMADVAVVDFVGKLIKGEEEPEEFPGGSAQDFQIELKEGQFIEGFIEGIVGMTLEESKEISVTFPENYPQEDLAGQDALFSLTLKELKEKELPDLDDDFAQEVSDFETLEELHQSLEERYQKEAKDRTTANKEKSLIDALVDNLEAEIPQTLVKREVDFLVTQTLMQLGNQGLDIQKFLTEAIVENMRERSQSDAIANLQRTIALGEVAKQESIEIDDEEVEAKMAEMLENADDPKKIDLERLREVIHEDLLKEKVLAWLEEHSTIELVPEGTLAPAEADTSENAPEAEETVETTDSSATTSDTAPATSKPIENTDELPASAAVIDVPAEADVESDAESED